jgi:hypothetical protein
MSSEAAISTSEQTARDILTGAIEGGMNFWAGVSEIERTEELDVISAKFWDANAEVNEEADFEPKTLTTKDIKAAIRKLATEAVKYGENYKDVARGLMFDGSMEYDWDANDADAIVQVAMFGEVVYG